MGPAGPAGPAGPQGPPGPDPFANYQHAESDGESQTNQTTYQQKLRMTTGSLAAGDYRIGYSAELASTNWNASSELRVEVDDTTTIAEPRTPTSFAANQYTAYSGFTIVTLTSGVHDIDVDYRSTNGSYTVKVRRARLEIYPVP